MLLQPSVVVGWKLTWNMSGREAANGRIETGISPVQLEPITAVFGVAGAGSQSGQVACLSNNHSALKLNSKGQFKVAN